MNWQPHNAYACHWLGLLCQVVWKAVTPLVTPLLPVILPARIVRKLLIPITEEFCFMFDCDPN
jgi:hypothetical protein